MVLISTVVGSDLECFGAFSWVECSREIFCVSSGTVETIDWRQEYLRKAWNAILRDQGKERKEVHSISFQL